MTTDTTRCVANGCLDGPDLDGQPGPRMAKTGLLCPRCYGRLERTLAELPAVTGTLRGLLGGSNTGGGENIRRTKGSPPLPLNVSVLDHLDLIGSVLSSWTRLVAEERGLRGPDTADRCSGWLLDQLAWVASQPWVDDLDDEVRDAARVAESLARTRPGWHPLPVPCPNCGGMTLGRWDGDDHVACPCGERWPEADYPRLVKVLADDLSMTTDEAMRVLAPLGVEPATFRQWVTRGHVRRLGTLDGMARYSRADVEAMTEDAG